ncbi:Maf family protein [Acetobacter fallax]|uniref:Nucleoside triphosphate pyrophosphatase n=1 Tax=Acetobacter fallax TaxID=1737473 RepID=A0ABX0K8K5_9PROT|nr:nucleoside triphosphate pyrophosphatase [Acetobacter fallax]NHO32725.1 Maf-like protein [Acetobacter fallax]NHO36215.1 Maf-like protein [Acetobacter fallax]
MTESSFGRNEVLRLSGHFISTRLVLASSSAARRSLLEASGLPFEVHTADVDENVLKQAGQAAGDSPATVAIRLASAKALAVSEMLADPHAMTIGADQMLSCDGTWFDKPVSSAQAREQLGQLRNRTHHLYSAVVLCQGSTILWHHVSTPALTMRAFSDAFLDTYFALDGGACLSCVGAYRLEGPGIHLFDRIEGEQSAILGLPLLPLLRALRDHGILAG